MAIFHYTIGGARQSRRRAILAAFGRLSDRECYRDARTGWTHDFTAKSPTMEASDHIARVGRHAEGSRQEVLFLALYAPADAPDWCRGAENIERFWNAAEGAEKRKDAQIAERVIIALPKELTLEQSRRALQDHIREFTREAASWRSRSIRRRTISVICTTHSGDFTRGVDGAHSGGKGA